MALHLFTPQLVAADLAKGDIAPKDQAVYVMAGFLVWTATYYLFLIPPPRSVDTYVFWWMWLVEFFFVVLLTITGIAFCLRNCRIDPRANFLIDFSCLYTPVTIRVVALVWGAFHLVATFPVMLIRRWNDAPEQLLLLPWLTSARAYDLLLLLAYVGMTFLIYFRIGEHMDKVSDLRLANGSAQPAPAIDAAGAER